MTTGGAKIVDSAARKQQIKEAERPRLGHAHRVAPTIEEAEAAHYNRNFLRDILTNRDGAGLHRFQIVVWTVALGVAFAFEVWKNLAMPRFDGTLLGLLGIGSATYVGFKTVEAPKPKTEKKTDKEPS